MFAIGAQYNLPISASAARFPIQLFRGNSLDALFDARTGDAGKLSFMEKLAESLTGESATELRTTLEKYRDAKGKRTQSADEEKKTLDAFNAAFKAAIGPILPKLAEDNAFSIGPAGPIVQYYESGSPVIQIQSIGALNHWRDAIVSNQGGRGLLQLMRPSCPACASIKGPLEQAMAMANGSTGLVAAIDVSCLASRIMESCPLRGFVESLRPTHWNGYIPAFIQVQVSPQGMVYQAIESAGRTAEALADMLRQQLALASFASYQDALSGIENEQLQRQANSQGEKAIIDLLGIDDIDVKGRAPMDRALRSIQRDLSWLKGIDAASLSPDEQKAMIEASGASADSILRNSLQAIVDMSSAPLKQSDEKALQKLCSALESI